ncbi:uncharacterized protein LOC142174503 [Nicotiana tabacum]|uniref:Uncharacterized protein LOC142174503 n=1 Tax=Nicotiana tabacum TaxID=4097 RepID=A0AC58TGR5_TOBAC
MPAYAKFLKEILSNKRKVEGTSVAKLTEHCVSINLMPLSIFRKLERKIGAIRSIHMSLQLADQTTILPEGIVENVLVRVDKFAFLIDFIVINIEENKEAPLNFRRPSWLWVELYWIQERQLMLRVGEEIVVFKINDAIGQGSFSA